MMVVKEETAGMPRIKFNIGDYEIKSHGRCVSFIVEYSGSPVQVEAAYSNACLQSGIDFGDIASKRKDWYLEPNVCAVFSQRGCPYLDDLEKVDERRLLHPNDYIKLLLWFIQEGAYKQDFEFKLVQDTSPEFSRNLGAGLFD